MSNTTPDGQALPLSLKLVFTNAANRHAVHQLFDPAIKSKIDPLDYVVKREHTVFEKQIVNGHGIMLVDSAGAPFALTMAWHNAASDKKGNVHNRYTEIGTTLSRLPGFHSAHPVVAALVLNEWWNHNPRKKIVGEILTENMASRKLFETNFCWKPVTSKAMNREIMMMCNDNVVEDNNDGKPHSWYRCEKETLQAMATSILGFMDRGVLTRKDGHAITIDLSAISQTGLTRTRLEAIAAGNTAKRSLRAIAP